MTSDTVIKHFDVVEHIRRGQVTGFVDPEKLATRQRELLLKRLEVAVRENGQMLVISDCHYSRAGFYVVYEEIGEAGPGSVDIDRIVDDWSMRNG